MPNFEKSSVLFSGKLNPSLKHSSKAELGFKEMKVGTIYLGNTFIFGKSKIKDFNQLKDRVQTRLEGWQSQTLSKAGKLTLMKYVAQAIPVYSMSTFKLPKKICKDMDSMIRRFRWGGKNSRFLALKSWSSICKPRSQGGLRLKRFEAINEAFLAKLGWDLASGVDKLWTSIFRAKYLSNCSFFGCKAKCGDSSVWRSILSSKQCMFNGSCFKIGNGWSINPSHDPWIPWLASKWTDVQRAGAVRRVAEFLNPLPFEWNEGKLRETFESGMVDSILNLDLPTISRDDCLIWSRNSNGKFSIQSCHSSPPTNDESNKIWKLLWKSPLHERLKLFCLRVVSGLLPTKSILNQRIGMADTTCWLCGDQVESLMHLFKYCNFTRAIALAGKWGIRLDGVGCNLVEDLVAWCFESGGLSGYDFGAPKYLIFVSLFYVIWTTRNKNIFGTCPNVALVVNLWEKMVDEFIGDNISKQLQSAESWKPPMIGYLEVHVDVAIGPKFAVVGMVAVKHNGHLTFIGSAMFDSLPLYLAKAKVLCWAFQQVAKEEWCMVDWRSDAQVVVNQVIDSSCPGN